MKIFTFTNIALAVGIYIIVRNPETILYGKPYENRKPRKSVLDTRDEGVGLRTPGQKDQDLVGARMRGRRFLKFNHQIKRV